VTGGDTLEFPDQGSDAPDRSVVLGRVHWRPVLSVTAVVLLAVAIVPPFGGWLRTYEWTESLQFALLAIVVPALLALGAPWRAIGLGPRVSRLADMRRRHPEASRTVFFVGAEMCAFVVWRIPPAVNWLERGAWQVLVEALVVIPVGLGFWLECVESPPLAPRSTRPVRIAAAAFAMWTIWVLAYLIGLSHADWYRAFIHHAGRGFSLAADQQITTGALWVLAACAFVPVIFWNLYCWLRSDEDPDQELHQLARESRRRDRWSVAADRSRPTAGT